MIVVCTILGTILVITGVWCCCTLFSDFCGDKDNEDEKDGKRRKSRRKRYKSDDDSYSRDLSDKISSISQLRKSHFRGSGSTSCSRHRCRSNRSSGHRRSSRPSYRSRYEEFSGSFRKPSARYSSAPYHQSSIPAEYSESLSSSQRGRQIIPPSQAPRLPPPLQPNFSRYASAGRLPATTSRVTSSAYPASLAVPKFAKDTEEQKKLKVNINDELLQDDMTEGREESD